MSRNPVIPYFLIMVLGIVLIFGLSYKGLADTKHQTKSTGSSTPAAQPSTNTPTTQPATNTATNQTSSTVDPAAIYQSTCIGCHGDQYQGVVGPSLKGIGKKLTVDQIKTIITHGKGNMPPNLVPADKADVMAAWVSKIK